MIEGDLKDYLMANADIQQLTSGRVYALVLPEKCEVPAISFRRESVQSIESMEGRDGLAFCNIRIESWGHRFEQSFSVGAAVRRAMDSYPGAILVDSSTGYEMDVGWYLDVSQYQISTTGMD